MNRNWFSRKLDGIIELAQDAPLALVYVNILDLNDVTIDVDLTANRGDCLRH